jgi:hypothetical protein
MVPDGWTVTVEFGLSLTPGMAVQPEEMSVMPNTRPLPSADLSKRFIGDVTSRSSIGRAVAPARRDYSTPPTII